MVHYSARVFGVLRTLVFTTGGNRPDLALYYLPDHTRADPDAPQPIPISCLPPPPSSISGSLRRPCGRQGSICRNSPQREGACAVESYVRARAAAGLLCRIAFTVISILHVGLDTLDPTQFFYYAQ